MADQGGKADAHPVTRDRLWPAAVVLGAVAYVLLVFELVAERYRHFQAGYDLAIFDQLTWLLARLDDPFSTVRGLPMLGDHFQPGVALLAPLGTVGPWGLLFAQTVALAANGPLLFVLARRNGARTALAALVAALWLLSPLVHSANLYDFHPETFVPLLLTLGALGLDSGRTWLFVAAAIVACSLKEDIALVYVMWGVVIAFSRRRLGIACSVVAAAWFVLAFKVGIPLFGGSSTYYSHRFGGGGSTFGGVLGDLATHPVSSVHRLASGLNAKMIVDLVALSAGLCLLAPQYLLLAVPTLAANVLSRYPQQHYLTLHYHVVAAGAFALAGAYGAARFPTAPVAWRRVAVAAGVVSIAALVLRPPGGDLVRGRTDLPAPPAATRAALREALSRVPAGAGAAFQYDALAHGANRRHIYVFPEPFVQVHGNGESWSRAELVRRAARVDWVISDRGSPYPGTAADLERALQELRRQGFQLVFARAGVRLYHRHG